MYSMTSVGVNVNVIRIEDQSSKLVSGAPSKLIRSEDKLCSTMQYSCRKVKVLYDELSRFATIDTSAVVRYVYGL